MISAWTRVSIDFLSKYWRICQIFLMDMVADWQVLVTWSDIEKCLSMITPKYRSLVAAAMSTPSTLTTRGCGGVGANLDMKCNTSVLDALMINLFWIDHEIMSVIHFVGSHPNRRIRNFRVRMIFRDNRVWSLPIFQSRLLHFYIWHFQLFL